MRLLKLTEYNDWEGETWNFFFWASEEDEHKLRDALFLMAPEISEAYTLDGKSYTKAEVEAFLKIDNEYGYMAPYQFLGVLDMSKFDNSSENPLYKGGISKFCKECDIGGV